MQSIHTRLDLLQSKLSKLIQKMETTDKAFTELQKENNRLQTKLKEQAELIDQWKSKANSVTESSLNEENRKMIKAEIDEYIVEINSCIQLLQAT